MENLNCPGHEVSTNQREEVMRKSGWAIRGHFEDSQSARIVAFSSQDRGGRTRGHRLAPVITLTQMKWPKFFSLKN